MSAVAIIAAKGFSSRIPKKNIRAFHGKPIIAYPLEAARESRLFSSIIVSTDDDEVAEIAHDHGADVLRRGVRWCLDNVGPLDVARHSLSLLSTEAQYVCVIYATAALMHVGDLVRGWKAVRHEGTAYACSVGTSPFLHDAAQFFWCRAWALRESVPEFAENTVLIPIHPDRDCDINEEGDWQRAEKMYEALRSHV